LSGSGRLSYGDKRCQLTEIRSADLRFSPAYAGSLVASVAQVKIGALALDPMEPSDPKAPLDRHDRHPQAHADQRPTP
jgi:hypothetical protein